MEILNNIFLPVSPIVENRGPFSIIDTTWYVEINKTGCINVTNMQYNPDIGKSDYKQVDFRPLFIKHLSYQFTELYPYQHITPQALDMRYIYNRSGNKYSSPALEQIMNMTGQTAAFKSYCIAQLVAQFREKWDALYNTLLLEYNPIENYNMEEEGTDTGTVKTDGEGTDTVNIDLSNTKTGTEEIENSHDDTDTLEYGHSEEYKDHVNRQNKQDITPGVTEIQTTKAGINTDTEQRPIDPKAQDTVTHTTEYGAGYQEQKSIQHGAHTDRTEEEQSGQKTSRTTDDSAVNHTYNQYHEKELTTGAYTDTNTQDPVRRGSKEYIVPFNGDSPVQIGETVDNSQLQRQYDNLQVDREKIGSYSDTHTGGPTTIETYGETGRPLKTETVVTNQAYSDGEITTYKGTKTEKDVTQREIGTKEHIERTGEDTVTTNRTGKDSSVATEISLENDGHDINHSGSDTRTLEGTGKGKTTFNITVTDRGKNSTTKQNNSTDTRDLKHTLKRSGNIGVTTSQQMIQQERDLWLWNFLDIVFEDLDSILTIPIYNFPVNRKNKGVIL